MGTPLQAVRGLYAVMTASAPDGERRVTAHLRHRNDPLTRGALALPGAGAARWLYGHGPHPSVRLPNRLDPVARALVGVLAEMGEPDARVTALYWSVKDATSGAEAIGPSPQNPVTRGITPDGAFDHRVCFAGPADAAWGRERRLAPALRQLLDGGSPEDPWGELGPLEDASDRSVVILSEGPLADVDEVVGYSNELAGRAERGETTRRTRLCLVTVADPLGGAQADALRAAGAGALWTVGHAERPEDLVDAVCGCVLPPTEDSRWPDAEVIEILEGGAAGRSVWRGELSRRLEFRVAAEAEAFEIRPANREPIRQPVAVARGPW